MLHLKQNKKPTFIKAKTKESNQGEETERSTGTYPSPHPWPSSDHHCLHDSSNNKPKTEEAASSTELPFIAVSRAPRGPLQHASCTANPTARAWRSRQWPRCCRCTSDAPTRLPGGPVIPSEPIRGRAESVGGGGALRAPPARCIPAATRERTTMIPPPNLPAATLPEGGA
jgi:hypothetical protein